jgi:hypothetical protein
MKSLKPVVAPEDSAEKTGTRESIEPARQFNCGGSHDSYRKNPTLPRRPVKSSCTLSFQEDHLTDENRAQFNH